MRGKDDVVVDDLYEGTAKSMEGVLSKSAMNRPRMKVVVSRWFGRMVIRVQQSQLPYTILMGRFTNEGTMLGGPTLIA